MKSKYLNKLEFTKIVNILSTFSITDLGKKMCLSLTPLTSSESVKTLLQETTEANILLLRKSEPPIAPLENISAYLKILKGNGTLTTKALLDLATVLKISRELKQYINNGEIDITFSTIVVEYFNRLYSNLNIENTIFSSILDENTIDDRASANLYKIRQNERKTESEIRAKLNSYLNTKYIQEPIITIRNNRFVIPVKQEYKSNVNGLLHDTSSSGSTLFIEPMSVFELNNKLNNLKSEENTEIEIILSNLSSLFFNITDELESNIIEIGKIDFAFAKAKYAKSINATEPIINDKKIIDLKKARHPLIDKNKVVPINIEIGSTYTTLVVTGPNTGGKTVTLKTIGLLTSMAMSGLYIPAQEKSSIYVFDNIFADIGDDQSITESLSTFSSHITNIVEIINNATSESLILLDELGSGTDPVEGSSLAVSILENLSQKNIITIATTHYPEVKNYALTNPKFENASSEFDLETLSPTYHILIGVPGRSMAFEISKKLGLDKNILENAQSRINNETVHIEEILKNIYDNQMKIQNEKEKIENYSKLIENTKIELEQRKNELEAKETSIISDAKIKARNILLEAKEESDDIIKQLNSANNSEASKLRDKLNKKIKEIKPENKNSNYNKLDKNSIVENMPVFVTTLNQEGIVLSKPNSSNIVSVQIGSMKMNVSIENLAPSTNVNVKKANSTIHTSSKIENKNVSSEINLIGLNVDEALFLIDKYLDDAKLRKIPTVRIIHGKGTGILRSSIHRYLKTNKYVESFRLGTFGEGETGVTVVELRK